MTSLKRTTQAAVLASALALTACSSGGGGSGSAASPTVSDSTLTWGTTTEPVCFDPHQNNQNNAFSIYRNYTETLLDYDEDGELVPWLATDWDVSKDGKTYTFTLRDDVTFSDGTPLTADAVKDNFDWVTDPNNTPGFAGKQLQYLEKTEAVSDTELTLTLSQPDGSLLGSLAGPSLGILAPSTLKLPAEDLCAGGSSLVGTGPFVFSDYERGQDATFTRNDDYNWAPESRDHQGPAYVREVVYRFLPESSVRLGALTSGQVDLIDGIQGTDVKQVDGAPGLTYQTAEHAGTSFSLNFNYLEAPLDDQRVRKAIQDGFDVDQLVDSVYFGTVKRAWSQVSSASSFYDPETENSWGNDIDGANSLLDEAGWDEKTPDGIRIKGGKTLTVTALYPQPYVRDNRDQLVQAVSAALMKNIGVDLELKTVPIGEFTDKVADGDWGLYPNSQAQADPGQSLFTLTDEQGNFLFPTGTKTDGDLHQQLIEASAATEPAERKAAYNSVQKYLLDEAYVIPLFVPTYQIGAQNSVRGITFQQQAGVPDGAYDISISD